MHNVELNAISSEVRTQSCLHIESGEITSCGHATKKEILYSILFDLSTDQPQGNTTSPGHHGFLYLDERLLIWIWLVLVGRIFVTMIIQYLLCLWAKCFLSQFTSKTTTFLPERHLRYDHVNILWAPNKPEFDFFSRNAAEQQVKPMRGV